MCADSLYLTPVRSRESASLNTRRPKTPKLSKPSQTLNAPKPEKPEPSSTEPGIQNPLNPPQPPTTLPQPSQNPPKTLPKPSQNPPKTPKPSQPSQPQTQKADFMGTADPYVEIRLLPCDPLAPGALSKKEAGVEGLGFRV